ncbi:MAG: hypothetical protein P8J37_14590 [Fuerstiella sp.]|nr:hypothetical protein [Fuerstiella sp.]
MSTAATKGLQAVVDACVRRVAVDVFHRFPEIPETSLKLRLLSGFIQRFAAPADHE